MLGEVLGFGELSKPSISPRYFSPPLGGSEDRSRLWSKLRPFEIKLLRDERVLAWQFFELFRQ